MNMKELASLVRAAGMKGQGGMGRDDSLAAVLGCQFLPLLYSYPADPCKIYEQSLEYFCVYCFVSEQKERAVDNGTLEGCKKRRRCKERTSRPGFFGCLISQATKAKTWASPNCRTGLYNHLLGFTC